MTRYKTKTSIDLKKLDNMLNKALEKETTESLNKWLSDEDSKDTVIQGWVARDKDGFIALYQNKPIKDGYDCNCFWHDVDCESHIELPITSFPDLTWSDKPQKCEIIVKRKKK